MNFRRLGQFCFSLHRPFVATVLLLVHLFHCLGLPLPLSAKPCGCDPAARAEKRCCCYPQSKRAPCCCCCEEGCSEEESSETEEKSAPLFRWVVGWQAQTCQGQGPLDWLAIPLMVPADWFTWQFDWLLVGSTETPSSSLAHVVSLPSIPPPRPGERGA